MTPHAAAKACYGGALFTLPWVGVGVLHLASGRDFGGGLQPSWVLLAAAVGFRGWAWLRSERTGDARESFRPPPVWLAIAVVVVGSVLISSFGIWWAPTSEPLSATLPRFGKQVIQLIIMATFTGWSAMWTRGAERWRFTARWLLAGALFQAAYGLLQQVEYHRPLGLLTHLEYVFTSNPSILSGSAELHLGDRFLAIPRLRGTACEPLYLGNYLLAVLPLVTLTAWSRARRWAGAGILLVVLLLTWSRGAWLAGTAVAMVGGGLWLRDALAGGRGPSTRRTVLRAVGGGLVAVVVVLLLGAWFGWDGWTLPWRRLLQSFSARDWSNLTRLYGLQAGWRAFLLSPVVGVGWGQFSWHYPVLVDPMGLQAMFSWPVASNYPLKILCETGVLGFGVLIVTVAAHVRAFARRWSGGDRHPALVPTTLALTGVALQMMTFSQYNLPHIWVSWGLCLAALAETRAARSGT